MSVVVVEDDQSVREMLAAVLRSDGHEVSEYPDAESALRAAPWATASLGIFDVGLPGSSGVELCRRLRRDGEALKVLMLTARHETADRVAGLDAGADDYLVKPFALDELRARVRALLRRVQPPGTPVESLTRTIDDLVLDVGLRSANRGHRQMDLTRREFELLWFLMGQSPLVVTRELLHDQVWGTESSFLSNSLEVFVSQLRRKLEAAGETRLIHTVRGVGYTLRSSDDLTNP